MDKKPIYGLSTKAGAPDDTECSCRVDPSIESSLSTFLRLLEIMRNNIEQYFPATNVASQIRGSFTVGLMVPPIILVRLIWRDRNPGGTQDRTNPLYLNALRDIYLEMMIDPKTDPLLKE